MTRYKIRDGERIELSPEEVTKRDAEELEYAAEREEEANKTNENRAIRDAANAIAQSAVGTRVDNLDAAQLKAMLAILLFQAGGLNRALEVRPLNEWAT